LVSLPFDLLLEQSLLLLLEESLLLLERRQVLTVTKDAVIERFGRRRRLQRRQGSPVERSSSTNGGMKVELTLRWELVRCVSLVSGS
jgi:hypothetical protein